jgi:hypothetical protein
VLPLAAGRNVGGHSTWHYFSSFFCLSEVLTFLPERRQLGFQNFAWAPKSQKYEDPNQQKESGTPLTPLTMRYLGGQGGYFKNLS